MPLITPTNIPVNRGAQNLQAVTETTPSLNGADLLNTNNMANSVPEPGTSRPDQAKSSAAAAAPLIISMTGAHEGAVGESHGSSGFHEPANEVEMVEEALPKEN